MRKLVLTVMASLLSCSAAQAFWPEATDSSLEIGVGYRQDRLKWRTSASIDSSSSSGYSGSGYSGSGYSGHGEGHDKKSVKLHSDLEWKNLNIWQIEIRGNYVTCDNIYLRGSADYGWITSGKNTDKDYIEFKGYSQASGSGDPLVDSHSHVKGNVYDVKFAVGYQFQLCDDTFSIAPLVGYSWHGQHFRDSHLRQRVNDPFLGEKEAQATRSRYYSDYYSDYYDESYSDYSYGGDHSKFHTRWNGPFIGFDFDYSFCCDWNLFGGYEFHWAQYHAKAHWDLRDDLVNGFNQRAKNAYGSVFDIGVRWDLCDCWTLALRGEFQWWWADHGHDRAEIESASLGDIHKKCHIDIPLHKIRWDSAAIMFDVGMVF